VSYLSFLITTVIVQLEQIITWLIHPIGWLFSFSRYVANRFILDRCPQTAAALTYTTLLSLVPMLAVGFSILAAFPVFKNFGDEIQNFIFTNFVPASQQVIQNYILGFADKATHLTAVGVIFLVITALLLMETIDHALNDIWQVHKKRSGVAVFMVYWAVLSLGPLLIGFSFAATSFVFSLPGIADFAQIIGLKQVLLGIMPFVLNTIAFSLIYVVVPNRYVSLYHGILGGVFAALLFETAKKGFAFYVTRFPTYELVYGTLAVIPIFLVWVYMSWLIILLGAEITRSLTIFHRDDSSPTFCVPRNALVWSFRIIGHLWQAQQERRMLNLNELQRLEPQFTDIALERLLNHLEQQKWLHLTAKGQYALSRDIHEVTLFDLYSALSDLLKPIETQRDEWDKILNTVLLETHQSLHKTMQVPLYYLYQKENFSE
jgi:membrane protein